MPILEMLVYVDFKGDVAGSKQHFCFSIASQHLSNELHIFESVI